MHMLNISEWYMQRFSKSSGTSYFPVYALSKHNQNKQQKKWRSSQSCHFVKNKFFGIKLLHANVDCVYIVMAKYQMTSVKALVQDDFPEHARSEH